jgi:hypothetical protein
VDEHDFEVFEGVDDGVDAFAFGEYFAGELAHFDEFAVVVGFGVEDGGDFDYS